MRGWLALIEGMCTLHAGVIRGSQSEFPLLTPTMQAGHDSDGGVGGFNLYVACRGYVVYCFCNYVT